MTAAGEERREITEINGEQIKVVYKTDGQKVEIVSAEKELAQQENKDKDQSSDQKEEGKTTQQSAKPTRVEIELTPAEKEKLQKTLENKVKQETKEERANIYDTKISPELFKNASPSEKPTIILLAGQGGSGKSDLTVAQEQRFSGAERAVTIDPDGLRKFNPDYYANVRTDSRTAAGKADVADWAQSAFLEAVSGKYNLVLDGTGGNSKSIEEKIDYARLKGYHVEVHAVAATPADSWQGILKRHEEGKKEDAQNLDKEPQARYVPKHAHDKSALGITEMLANVEYKGKADYIALYERGKYDTPIYENTSARLGGTIAAAEAFEKERHRARTPEEMERRSETIQSINKNMDEREASRNERVELTSLAFEGKNKGFSETARDILPDRRPDISAQEYIKNPEARKEVRAQAKEHIKAYADELRQKGVSEERVSKVENSLQRKLDNPATAYGIKEGLELRDARKKADASYERRDQEAFCDKRERFVTDVRTVKKTFGADIKERTPEQQAYDKSRASWYRHGRITLAKAKKQMTQQNVPPPDQDKKLERMKRDLKDAAKKSIDRQYKRNAQEVTQDYSKGRSQGMHRRMSARFMRSLLLSARKNELIL